MLIKILNLILKVCLCWVVIRSNSINNLWAKDTSNSNNDLEYSVKDEAKDTIKDTAKDIKVNKDYKYNKIKISNKADKAIDNTDWLPLPFCSKSGIDSYHEKANKLCSGCYLEPEYPLAITKNHQPDTLIINADRTKIISKGLSRFDGNVVVAKNNQQITADHATTQQDHKGNIKYIQAEGRVKITQPGLRFFGKFAKFLPRSNYKVIYESNYRLYDKHATGDADLIEVFDDKTINMSNASYTTCKPGSDNWFLLADRVKLDKVTGRGEAWNAKLYIKNQQVFYWPYINFSIDKRRQSGFLMPTLSTTSKHGLEFSIPWYWNIAPNYDYTLSSSYFSKRGYKFNNQFRYLTNNSSGALGLNFLPRDRANLNFVKDKLINPGDVITTDLRYRNLKQRNSRYFIWFNNKTTIQDGWDLYINYHKASDDNYLQNFGKDIGQDSIKSNNSWNNLGSGLEESLHNSDLHLNQSIRLENKNKYGVLNFNLSRYQTLHPFNGPITREQYKKLPEINWQANHLYLPYEFRTKHNFSYVNFRLKNVNNVDNNNELKHNLVVGNRIHGRYEIEQVLRKPYGYLEPRVQLDLLSYRDLKLIRQDNLESNRQFNSNSHRSRIIPILDFKGGLNFIRRINNRWNQSLEPKIYYLYVPKVNQDRYPVFDTKANDFNYYQLFRDSRYSGVDRLSDTNQITTGIKTTLISSINGEEKASLGIAKARFFRKLTAHLNEHLPYYDKWSPTALYFNYNVNPQWSIEANITQEKLNKILSNTYNAKYNLSDDKIFNLGYHYVRSSTVPQHQGQFSIAWAVKEGISVLSALDYDLSKKRLLYSLIGLEFNGCCTVVRLAWAKSVMPTENLNKTNKDNKILLQVVFKGFTDVGNLENNYILNKIPGYHSTERF